MSDQNLALILGVIIGWIVCEEFSERTRPACGCGGACGGQKAPGVMPPVVRGTQIVGADTNLQVRVQGAAGACCDNCAKG